MLGIKKICLPRCGRGAARGIRAGPERRERNAADRDGAHRAKGARCGRRPLPEVKSELPDVPGARGGHTISERGQGRAHERRAEECRAGATPRGHLGIAACGCQPCLLREQQCEGVQMRGDLRERGLCAGRDWVSTTRRHANGGRGWAEGKKSQHAMTTPTAPGIVACTRRTSSAYRHPKG